VVKLCVDEYNKHFRYEDCLDPLLRHVNDARELYGVPTVTTARRGKTIEPLERPHDLAMHPDSPYEVRPQDRSYYSNFETGAELRWRLARNSRLQGQVLPGGKITVSPRWQTRHAHATGAVPVGWDI
jgi:hypothetical protein